MEKLLVRFIELSKKRGFKISDKDIAHLEFLAKKGDMYFYSEFSKIAQTISDNIIIPVNTASFYVTQKNENDCLVLFFDCSGNKIKELVFKNCKKEKLEFMIFQQLVGGEKNENNE